MSDQQKAYEDMSIEQVLDLIDSGEITAQEVLDHEMQGKKRKTLISVLEKMIPPPEEIDESVSVVFLQNTKHNKTFYQAGQKAEVPAEDYEVLLAAKVIRPREE